MLKQSTFSSKMEQKLLVEQQEKTQLLRIKTWERTPKSLELRVSLQMEPARSLEFNSFMLNTHFLPSVARHPRLVPSNLSRKLLLKIKKLKKSP